MNDSIGRFSWFDLLTIDVDAARRFYGEVAGWTDEPCDGGSYFMFNTAGAGVGGVMALPAHVRAGGVPPHWLGHVAVVDVEETVSRALRLGGTSVVPSTALPGVGRFAVLADPQGAVIALATTARDCREGAGTDDPGFFTWAELHASGWESAWRFYAELFGWTSTGSFSMGPQWGTYFMFGPNPDQAWGAMFDGAKVEGVAPRWHHVIRVDDTDEAALKVAALGGEVVHGPADIPVGGGRVAQCRDPQGAFFGLAST